MPPAFRILGPLEVTLDERPVSLGGGRERAILAVLLLNIGEVVSVERLIDGVWGDARPASAKHMIHEYVSRLRQTLDEGTTIATRPPGYQLEPADETLDARQFAQLTAAARSAAREERHDDALRAYQQGLALWRGETLADIGLEGHALIAATRLDQERRLVDEERVDCALVLGQHLQLIPELEHRVQQSPLRERSRAQLMLALYRAGRQTEALDSYREGRALLVEQAGVEPGRELRELERAILTHDPALELGLVRPSRPERARAPVRRRGVWVAASIALLAVAVVVVAFAVGRSGSGHTLARIDANSAGAIDPGSNRLVDEVAVGAGPGRLAAGFGSLWVVNDFDDTVSRVNPATGAVQARVTVDGDPTAIAVGAGFVWVACTGNSSVDQISPELDRTVQQIPVGNGPSGIAISPGAVWVTNRFDDTVTEIDAKTGDVRRRFDAGPNPSDIAYGFDALWITNESAATITRLDPSSGVPEQFPVGNGPVSVAVGDNSVWVANSIDGTVSRVDPRSGAQGTVIPVGKGPSSVLSSDDAIWVADSYGDRIVRIDPTKNGVVREIAVGNGPQGLAAIDGRIWLSARETSTAHRGGTLRLFDTDGPDSLDQGLGYAPNAWAVAADTSDGLVGFKRVGGLDGGTLVPDLATSIPVPTNRGLTYTFQLRRGIRYSNGDLVQASDLRRAIEREFRMGEASFYEALVGADACSRSRCDLSRGIETNDSKGTVVLRLRKPDPDMLYKLAVPFGDLVPKGVSMTKPERLGVPGTGPYMIASFAHSVLVLVRNPHFRRWSAAAQPDGYPDRIILTFDGNLDAELTDVERGRGDVMESPLPISRTREITTRYAAQVHVFQYASTFAIFLNTRLPPFDNLKARLAFNLAIDRSKAIPAFGGVKGATVTCQILPAGYPGYRPYCPYTKNPTTGIWTAPDLARAKKLVAASGTYGEKVVFYTGSKQFQRVIGRLGLATLKELGYDARLKVLPRETYFGKVYDSRTRAQAGFDAWSQDYPAASNFLMLFTCRSYIPASPDSDNSSGICDRRIDKAFDDALAGQTPDAPASANVTWSAVDRLVTNLAPWAPIVNSRDVVIVSRRAGNVQGNTEWGVLFDQIWVR